MSSSASARVINAISCVASFPLRLMWSTQARPFGGINPLFARYSTYSMNFRPCLAPCSTDMFISIFRDASTDAVNADTEQQFLASLYKEARASGRCSTSLPGVTPGYWISFLSKKVAQLQFGQIYTYWLGGLLPAK